MAMGKVLLELELEEMKRTTSLSYGTYVHIHSYMLHVMLHTIFLSTDYTALDLVHLLSLILKINDTKDKGKETS